MDGPEFEYLLVQKSWFWLSHVFTQSYIQRAPGFFTGVKAAAAWSRPHTAV